MSFHLPIPALFSQLESVLQNLSPEKYTQNSRLLFNATIGQHVRHILELFIELNKGYENGTVNYSQRQRDYRIESDPEFAITLMQQLSERLDKPDKFLQLQPEEYELSEQPVGTTYHRELLYNLDHTVHHMALIRVGLQELTSIEVSASFGVAASTIQYRNRVCAQ